MLGCIERHHTIIDATVSVRDIRNAPAIVEITVCDVAILQERRDV